MILSPLSAKFKTEAVRFFLIAALFFAGMNNHARATNLLTNGGFENDDSLFNIDFNSPGEGRQHDVLDPATEQDITGWTVDDITNGTQVEWAKHTGGTNFAAHDGVHYVELQGAPAGQSIIYQSFTTIVGKKYQLTLWVKAIGGSTDDQKIRARFRENTVSGTILAEQDFTGAGQFVWVKRTLAFTATTTTTVVSFQNITDASNGTHLDDVSVVILPELTVTKAVYPYDPGNANLKMIPGQNIVFEWGVKNTGGSPDAGTLKLDMSIPSDIAFKIGSVTFEDGTIVSSGANGAGQQPSLTGDTTPGNTGMTVGSGQIDYSNVGTGSGWGYNPSADFTDGVYSYDNDVRAIRVTPAGTMADGTTAPHVGFRVYYQGRVK